MPTADNKQTEFQQRWKKHNVLYLVFGYLFIATIIVFGIITYRIAPASDTMPSLSISGTYFINGEEEGTAFSDLDEITGSNISTIRIEGTLQKEISAGEYIFFFVHRSTATMYIDGTQVFEETADWDQKWYSYRSGEIPKGTEIVIEIDGLENLNTTNSILRTVDRLYVGEEIELLRQQIFQNVIKIVLSLIMLVLGLSQLILATSLVAMKSDVARGSISSSLVMIAGSLCCFIDYNYINLIIQDDMILFVFDAMMQISLAFMLMLTLTYQMNIEKNWKRSYRVLIAWGAVLAVYGVAYFGLQIQKSQEFWIISLIGITGVFIAIEVAIMLLDFFQGKDQIRYPVAIADLILTVSLLIEIIHFVVAYYYMFYAMQIGFIAYAIIQFYIINKRMKQRERLSARANELEKELVESKITLMLSQIRPHFLYNSITAIQMLCVEDPKRAQKALGDFAKYLRGNMDSLSSRDLIPFEKELDHTEHYVELELLRQGEYLTVEYEIEERDFLIPALTLQPIVENAIKHGLTPKENGGKVVIETKRLERDVIITVVDDGVGFDPSVQKGDNSTRSHIGMENVRGRIERMAGGRLEVESQIGVGTKVTIVLPQEEV